MNKKEVAAPSQPAVEEKPVCGLIMPISPVGDYTEQHWVDVRRIITEAIEPSGFEVRIVSDADDSGIIQKRIVQNLYDNECVVCDVSSKNPNVMFELGLRLAFDKPTIVIKDDKTDYSFDTSPIEHVTYPRDLRYGSIVLFKEKLKGKVEGTYAAFKKSPSEYSTFLKSFGEFRVPRLEQKEVSKEEFMVGAIEDLTAQMRSIRAELQRSSGQSKLLRSAGFSTHGKVTHEESSEAVVKIFLNAYLKEVGKKYLDYGDVDAAVERLESIKAVREACGSPDVLKKLVENEALPF
jgi:hypothetical protein